MSQSLCVEVEGDFHTLLDAKAEVPTLVAALSDVLLRGLERVPEPLLHGLAEAGLAIAAAAEFTAPRGLPHRGRCDGADLITEVRYYDRPDVAFFDLNIWKPYHPNVVFSKQIEVPDRPQTDAGAYSLSEYEPVGFAWRDEDMVRFRETFIRKGERDPFTAMQDISIAELESVLGPIERLPYTAR
ncbi:MAG: hypothetical protein ACU0BS_11820 [Hasllibacter sp.]